MRFLKTVEAPNPPSELYINLRKVIPFPVALLYKPVRGFVPQLIVCSQRINIR